MHASTKSASHKSSSDKASRIFAGIAVVLLREGDAYPTFSFRTDADNYLAVTNVSSFLHSNTRFTMWATSSLRSICPTEPTAPTFSFTYPFIAFIVRTVLPVYSFIYYLRAALE